MHLYVLRGSQNKQRLFLFTALTYRFLQPRQSVYCAVRAGSLNQTDTVSSLKGKTALWGHAQRRLTSQRSKPVDLQYQTSGKREKE
jgi:hypothetical protein